MEVVIRLLEQDDDEVLVAHHDLFTRRPAENRCRQVPLVERRAGTVLRVLSQDRVGERLRDSSFNNPRTPCGGPSTGRRGGRENRSGNCQCDSATPNGSGHECSTQYIPRKIRNLAKRSTCRHKTATCPPLPWTTQRLIVVARSYHVLQ